MDLRVSCKPGEVSGSLNKQQAYSRVKYSNLIKRAGVEAASYIIQVTARGRAGDDRLDITTVFE